MFLHVRPPLSPTHSIIFCEAVGIYGLIIALLTNNKVKTMYSFPQQALANNMCYGMRGGVERNGEQPHTFAFYIFTGGAQSHYTLFAAGITVGLGNFACGIAVGLVGSACAIADAADSMAFPSVTLLHTPCPTEELFVQILIVEIFASALGIFALIVGILQSNQADFQCHVPTL